jgi:hypothetical protein
VVKKSQHFFFDGLYLTYKCFHSTGSIGKFLTHYEFRLLSNGKFDVLLYSKSESGEKSPDSKHRLSINSMGEFKDKDILPLWLPERYRREAARWRRCVVERKDHWEKWDVWVAKDVVGSSHYYEATTGFWVGSETSTRIGGMKIILVETNANIPTAE